MSKIAAKHKATIDTGHGPRTCFEAHIQRPGKQPLVARFGGIPLARERNAVLIDRVPARPVTYTRKEPITRLRRGKCEHCHEPDKVQVHQVRKLTQLLTGPDQPPWTAVMTRMRRKTLIVCRPCHDIIHHTAPVANTA